MTLLEVTFAGLIATGILASGFMIVTSAEKASTTSGQTAETQQNVRIAMDMLTMDIKQAGFGMTGQVGNCQTAIVPQDQTIGGPDTGPDRISLVVPVGNPVANPVNPAWTLQSAIGPGFNQLPLSSAAVVASMQSQLNVATLTGLTVTVGGSATAIVLGTAGSLINITPIAAPAAFGLNAPIYVLQCITYQVIAPPDPNQLCDGRFPCLVRGVGTVGAGGALTCDTPNSLCRSIADEIEDIQFAYACDGCNLGINGGVPNDIIDNQGGAAGFDQQDFISNNSWALAPMTPDKIRLVQVTVVGRQRVADQGVGGSNINQTVVQAQALQVADHNHAAGVYAAGDFAGLNPPYTGTRRRMFSRTVEVRNPGR